jgi:hypothetical protein
MPINPNIIVQKDDKTFKELIAGYNDLEKRIKQLETMFTTLPGDYPIECLLGMKTASGEGKVVPYTAAEVKTLLGI